jgi:ribosome-associated toxin RatA of RatAB toxin-antitoxin module
MSTKVEKRILVNVPVSTAYNQWTQFEDFPQFMGGIKSVTQLSDDRLQWVAEIAGVKRQWEARILEQVPDRKVSWAATEGATNAGSVTFEDVGGGQTSIQLFLEYEPEGLIEKVGDKLNVVENQAEGDLERFKAFIESEGYASGAWRGSVNEGGAVGTPGVEHAGESRGDSGKAGVSGKVVAGAVGLAAAAAVGVAAAAGGKDTDKDTDKVVDTGTDRTVRDVTTPASTVPVTATTDTTDLGAGQGTDRAVAHPFDQTNGLADVDGESDGTAASDTRSAAERGTDTDPLR